MSVAFSATALVVVVLGSTPVGHALADAVVPRNSVGTQQLRNGAVTGPKLAANAVTTAKVRDGSLLASDFKAGQLPKGEKGDKGERGEPGPSDAFSIAKKGPVGFRNEAVTVATLPIPQAGKYVVSGKLWLFDLVPSPAQVACRLSAGGTEDFARVSFTGLDAVMYATPALQLAHEFASPGSVTLTCAEVGFSSAVVSANDIVVTAIKVGNLTQTRE